MTTRSRRKLVMVVLLALPAPVRATSPVPTATAPIASPTATGPTATQTPVRPTITVTPAGVPSPRVTATATTIPARAGSSAEQPVTAPAEAAAPVAAVATAIAPRPRAYRTPERAGGPVFMAPGGAAPDATVPERMPAPAAPAARAPTAQGGTSLVVFRATARTAIEGFDVRVSYPRSLGSFATNGQQADCNAGTGTLVIGSDRSSGELRLLVAGAQALPLPLDVFCRFARTGGGSLDASQFEVRVAEVTVDDQGNAKRGDPSLLIVNVVVR